MTVKFGMWHDATKESPKKDGNYLVVGFWGEEISYGAVLSYSVKHGWNTFVDCNGVAHTDSRIDFSTGEYDEPGNRIWCDTTEFVGGEVNETN